MSEYLPVTQQTGQVKLDNTTQIEGEAARAIVRYKPQSATSTISSQEAELEGEASVQIPSDYSVNVVIQQRFETNWQNAGGQIIVN